MTLFVVAVSQKEAELVAGMVGNLGHRTRKSAERHLREVQAPPTDPFYARQYKIWKVAAPPAMEQPCGDVARGSRVTTTWSTKRTPIKTKVVAPRICEVCTDPYTPKWEEQRTCGGRCARILGGRQLAGRLPEQFAREIEKRKRARKAAIERECARRWPELSVREIEIFNHAIRIGYNRGYSKGLHSQRRQKRSAA